MVIEFIGTPGAGKTTLLPAVIEHIHDSEGIRASTVLEASRIYAKRTFIGKIVSHLAPEALHSPLLWQVFYYYSLFYRLKFAYKHPQLVKHVISSQLRRPRSAGVWNRRVLKWFFHLAGSYEFLNSRILQGEALVLDEGFVHRVVQMNASDVEEPDLAKITAYIDLLPSPDVVIVPVVPLEVCEKRVFQRGVWKHFKHKTSAEISRYLANSYHVVTMTTDYIKHKGWSVIEVDNGSDDPAPAIAELRLKLAKTLKFANHQPGWQAERLAI